MCCVFLSKAHHFSPSTFEHINSVPADPSSTSHSPLSLSLSVNFLVGFSYTFFFGSVELHHSATCLSYTSHDFYSSCSLSRMRSPSSLKRDFLKKWIMGLRICSFSKKNMSTVMERKKAIKLSADLAMASARNGTTCWSRALIANATKDDDNKVLIEHVLGPECERLKKVSIGSVMCKKRVRCKKILKRSCSIQRVRKCVPQMVLPSSIAKRLVKKRTQVLKTLVPGGEFMDEISLIKETLDYIVSLRAQVAVMKTLASASGLVNGN